MSYKSPRLLTEAIHKEMEAMRKLLMDATPGAVTDDGQTALETLNLLRGLIDELSTMAGRPSLDDVKSMTPTDYVATMKPLVRIFHQLLMQNNLLCECLNEDLRADATVLFLIGEGKTIVRAAHDPQREQVALAVETILAGLDESMKQVAVDAAEAAGQQLAATPMEPPAEEPSGDR